MQCDWKFGMPLQYEVMMSDGLLGGNLHQPVADGLSARALLASIRRHFGIVVAFTLSLCAAGAVIGLGLPAWYQAEGVLVIHARPQRLAELQELPDPSPDLYVIQSEADILQSRSVIEPVVRSLRLWEAPEFQPTEYPKGWSWQIVEARLREIWPDTSAIESNPEDSSGKPIPATQPADTS